MGATILITREERPGERELGAEMGLSVVFLPLTSVVFGAALRGDPPPAPPSDPSFHSGSQGGVCHPDPEQSEGPYIAPRASHLDSLSGSQGEVCHPEQSEGEGPSTNNKQRTTNIAFTSRNAVEALRAANLLHLLEHRTIWCVGPSTASALGDIPHRISPGTTGEDLARFMIDSGVTGDVLHICGNPHRPELRSVMLEAGCRMQEWVVYETVPVEAERPSEKIDAVAFFSPSAVKQFKNLGWMDTLHVPYIAIGPTTASELLPCSCTVSSEASFRGVLETSKKILNDKF